MTPTIPKDDLLYHYCSSETFLSIVRNRKIRLSSILQSNDYTEGKLLRAALERFAKQGNLSDCEQRDFETLLAMIEQQCDGLAFCLTSNDDVLSQWWRYGDDGFGVEIGFSTSFLDSLETPDKVECKVTLETVKYTDDEHDSVFTDVLGLLRKADQSLAELSAAIEINRGSAADREINWDLLKQTCQSVTVLLRTHGLLGTIFTLKGVGFREEKERRLLCPIFAKESALMPFPVKNTTVECCSRRANIVPYVECTLTPQSIQKVVLGPRHQTPIVVIKNFLKDCAFADVSVAKSKISYR